MGMSSIKTPLLQDDDNEDDVALPGSSSAAGALKAREDGSRRGAVLLTVCCLAAFLLPAALISYRLHLRGGAEDNGEYYMATRTSFHFQPEKGFMGDPCAPMYYKGYYHFFYQYNPHGALWDIPHWGHTVSTDLIHWKHLGESMGPEYWYDISGTWTGSATILADGTPAVLYTGGRPTPFGTWKEQSQNLALPVDPSDPLLREWKKADVNPVLLNPDFVRTEDFRDPTAGWLENDGLWRMSVGSRRNTSQEGVYDGIALMYTSEDFFHWKLEETLIHTVAGNGIWECVDLYPIWPKAQGGLNRSGLHYVDSDRYVLKVSVNDIWTDNYALGTYSTKTHTFTPDDPTIDVGIGLRYDYGRFYASRSFYDTSTGRRILWGYANESDIDDHSIAKGWFGIQGIPRTIWLDDITQQNLVIWPVEEVEALRGAKASQRNVDLQPTDILKVVGGDGPQLDILVVFEKPNVSSVGEAIPDSKEFNCGLHGSSDRGIFGPFGLLVRTDEEHIEQTAVFFYISLLKDGQWATRVCTDQHRSTLAVSVDKTSYGTQFMVMPTETELSLRVLLDNSIIEAFAQGGRVAITSRVEPTIALGSKSHTFLFNNGTTPIHVKSLDVFQMGTVNMTRL